MKQLIILTFCIFNINLNLTAQEKSYKPDSVIHYTYTNGDTNQKRFYKKEIYTYEVNGRLQKKEFYQWDNFMNSWSKNLIKKYQYITDDVIVSNFHPVIDSILFIEIYKFNKNSKKIKEYRKEIRNNDKSLVLVERTVYEYENDILLKKEHFVNSTTFFKKFLTLYKPSGNAINFDEIEFDEITKSKKSHHFYSQNFEKNILKSSILKNIKDSTLSTKTIYSYDKNSNQIADSTFGISANNKIPTTVTKYSYDSKTNQLKSKLETVKQSKENNKLPKTTIVSYYYCKPNSPILARKYDEYIIE